MLNVDLHLPNSLKFLPDEWDEKAIYIRSTDYNRTQESVQQLVSAGLYPPEKRDESFSLKIRTRYNTDALVILMCVNARSYFYFLQRSS